MLFGDAPRRQLPAWVTGQETPDQRYLRLRAVNKQLVLVKKRDEEARSRSLFRELEHATAPISPARSPASPPRQPEDPPDTPPFPFEDAAEKFRQFRDIEQRSQPPAATIDQTNRGPGKRLVLTELGPPVGAKKKVWVWTDEPAPAPKGTPYRYNEILTTELERYADTFGVFPEVDSDGYDAALLNADDKWKDEQKGTPSDLLFERSLNLREQAKNIRGEVPPIVLGQEHKSLYGKIVQKIKDDSYATAVGAEVVSNPTRLRAEREIAKGVDTAVAELQAQLQEDSGGKLTRQELQEQTFLTLKVQENLSSILTEWGWSEEQRQASPPPSAVDEAMRRVEEDYGNLLREPKRNKALLDSVMSATASVFAAKWMPTLDSSNGYKPVLASLDDIHRGGQVVADPVARGMVSTLAWPALFAEKAIGEQRLPTLNEIRDADTEGVVSGKIRGQLAEDVLSEIISPEFILLGLPFAGAGVANFSTRGGKLIKITANLLGSGLEPNLVRGTYRGLTAFAKNPRAYTDIPAAVRGSKLFQEGAAAIERGRASEYHWWGTPTTPKLGASAERVLSDFSAGRVVGKTDDELRAIAKAEGIATTTLNREGIIKRLADRQYQVQRRGNDPMALKQVVRDLSKGKKSPRHLLPLREAVQEDLTNGRSLQSIVDDGISNPAFIRTPDRDVTVYHGFSSFDENAIIAKGLPSESTVFVSREAAEAQAKIVADLTGGEARVVGVRMKKTDLVGQAGKTEFVTNRSRGVATLSQKMESTLSEPLRKIIAIWRRGENVNPDELRTIAGESAEISRFQTQDYEGLLGFLAREIVQPVPGATADRIATQVLEALDTPVSPGGIVKWFAQEEGGSALGRFMPKPKLEGGELLDDVLARTAANEPPGVTLTEMRMALTEWGGPHGGELAKTVTRYSETLSEMIDMVRGNHITAALEKFSPSFARKVEAVETAFMEAIRDGKTKIAMARSEDLRVLLEGKKGLLKNKVFREMTRRYIGGEVTPRTIATLLENQQRTLLSVVNRFFERGTLQDALELTTKNRAPKLIGHTEESHKALFKAFGGKHGNRAALDDYIRLTQTQIDALPETSIIKRKMLEADLKHTEFSWKVIQKSFDANVLEDEIARIADDFKVLIKEHRGTLEERLAKLGQTERAKIEGEVDDIIRQTLAAMETKKGTISKVAQGRFRERILKQALDIDTVGHYDAGRALEAVIRARVRVKGEGRPILSKKTLNEMFGGLTSLVEGGTKPSEVQLVAMQKVLGNDLVRALVGARGVLNTKGEKIIDVLGLPRAIMTSMDMSSTLRQGAILGPRNFKRWAAMVGVQREILLAGPKSSQEAYAKYIEALHLTRGGFRRGNSFIDFNDYGKDVGLFLASNSDAGLTGGEEAFMTNFAKMIPGITRSDRAYTLGIDSLRASFFDDTIRGWMKSSKNWTDKDASMLADFINNATGRGGTGKLMGEWLRKNGPWMNSMFFSPRLAISRVMIGGDVGKAVFHPRSPAGQRILGTIAADVAFFSSVLAMVHYGGKEAGVSVDFSPFIFDNDGKLIRVNTNWGRVTIGNSHIDMFAGFHPTARLLFNTVIAAQSGDLDRIKMLSASYARSKLAPVAGAGVDWLTGEDFVGRKVETSLTGGITSLLNMAAPLGIVQAPLEALQAEQGETNPKWWNTPWTVATSLYKDPSRIDEIDDELFSEKMALGLAVGATEFWGTGTSSYFNPSEEIKKIRDADSNAKFGLDYSDPESSAAKRKEVNTNPRIEELQAQQEEEGIARGKEWAENSKETTERLESVVKTGKDSKNERVITNWTQQEIDGSLERGEIDGPTWIARHSEIQQNIAAWNNGLKDEFKRDPDEEVSAQQKAIDAYWEITPRDYKSLQTGEIDWDGYTAARERAKAKAIDTEEEGEVTTYFESFTADRSDMEKSFDKAKIAKKTAEAIPDYVGGFTRKGIKDLNEQLKTYLLESGSSWGVARYVRWLYYNGGAEYQTEEMAVAYWVALGEGQEVENPEIDEFVSQNAEAVQFYPSMFSRMTDSGKQDFFDQNRVFLSRELQKSLLEEEDVVDNGVGPSTGAGQQLADFLRR